MNEASDKGFLEHYFRLKCGKSFIVFFSQDKFKFLGIINVDFENMYRFIQKKLFIYKSQKKITISVGWFDKI